MPKDPSTPPVAGWWETRDGAGTARPEGWAARSTYPLRGGPGTFGNACTGTGD